jgi:hypothetical protein
MKKPVIPLNQLSGKIKQNLSKLMDIKFSIMNLFQAPKIFWDIIPLCFRSSSAESKMIMSYMMKVMNHRISDGKKDLKLKRCCKIETNFTLCISAHWKNTALVKIRSEYIEY